MGLVDLITRVDSICKKYEKYDLAKQREEANISGDDAFSRLYSSFESALETLLQKTEEFSSETNRAKAVAMNAEIRRTKARLLEGVPKLQRLALKKVKGLSQEELDGRNELVLSLSDKIEAVQDGSAPGNGWAASTSYTNIRFDTNVSERFAPMYQMAELIVNISSELKSLDQGLDFIAEGLDTLKNMAQDINEVWSSQRFFSFPKLQRDRISSSHSWRHQSPVDYGQPIWLTCGSITRVIVVMLKAQIQIDYFWAVRDED
ncbi:hypothetical protein DY000_02056814 [Brassica cretica]|uniref:Syntaxin N-terminal domain-containing protein n=1 Tax=Brassica cretica TaxID=69181 RepID=A0ABQ7ALR2_BRACR|nr:hypothetical protein DY000_02056814 [Brassica cretica]